jgi:hypothetical protein
MIYNEPLMLEIKSKDTNRGLARVENVDCFFITRGFEELYISAGSGASLCEGFENFATICFRVRVQPTFAHEMAVLGIGLRPVDSTIWLVYDQRSWRRIRNFGRYIVLLV